MQGGECGVERGKWARVGEGGVVSHSHPRAGRWDHIRREPPGSGDNERTKELVLRSKELIVGPRGGASVSIRGARQHLMGQREPFQVSILEFFVCRASGRQSVARDHLYSPHRQPLRARLPR